MAQLRFPNKYFISFSFSWHSKGRLQNQKLAKLGTLSQQEGGRSEGLPKCPDPYFEPGIEHTYFSNSNVVPLIEDRPPIFLRTVWSLSFRAPLGHGVGGTVGLAGLNYLLY